VFDHVSVFAFASNLKSSVHHSSVDRERGRRSRIFYKIRSFKTGRTPRCPVTTICNNIRNDDRNSIFILDCLAATTRSAINRSSPTSVVSDGIISMAYYIIEMCSIVWLIHRHQVDPPDRVDPLIASIAILCTVYIYYLWLA